MADDPDRSADPSLSRRRLGPREFLSPEILMNRRLLPGLEWAGPADSGTAPPEPAPVPAAAVPGPMQTPPQAPPANPFAELPFPSAGDRIKADDFRRLSQSLRVLFDTYALSGATFGYPFGQVKLALAAQQYEIAHVVSVFGTELTDGADPALDGRKVLQVVPVVLGERRVSVVVTEPAAAAAAPRMPDLVGLTYRQAADRIETELGDAVAQGGPMVVPDLSGMTLTEATRRFSG